jgi:hypothetical protein
MHRLNVGTFGGKTQRLGADAEISGSLGQIEPRFDAVFGGTVDRDFVMRTQRGHALAGPTVALACRQFVPVQQPGDQIIIGNEDKLPDGVDNIGRGAAALTTPPARANAAAYGRHPSSG